MLGTPYPIGEFGKPWQQAEKDAWLVSQQIKRSYHDDVLCRFNDYPSTFKKIQYGELKYKDNQLADKNYPLLAFVPSNWQSQLPTILITGGVHGYETSGVQGACEFLLVHASGYLTAFNLVIAPCVSPWAYETINRWNPLTLDPNRSFYKNSPAQESANLMAFITSLGVEFLAHIDLHETTDTDDTEFRPALAAKEGTVFSDWGIPDGFYLVADSQSPQASFQKAIIDEVMKVTHIAPPDGNNQMIGADVYQHGVICYDKKALFLCGGITHAPYVTTTEVYPDSPKATPDICIEAQVAALEGGLRYLKQL